MPPTTLPGSAGGPRHATGLGYSPRVVEPESSRLAAAARGRRRRHPRPARGPARPGAVGPRRPGPPQPRRAGGRHRHRGPHRAGPRRAAGARVVRVRRRRLRRRGQHRARPGVGRRVLPVLPRRRRPRPPGRVSALVAAAERWDADVVGPKLVAGTTRAACPVRPDGRQGRAWRCRSSSPASWTRASTTACATCSRCRARSRWCGPARFAEVGGFDEGIDFLGDDLSLCWRVRVAGGRVLVTSAARVRHAEAFADRPDRARDAAALAARHRVRVAADQLPGRGACVTIVPQALLLTRGRGGGRAGHRPSRPGPGRARGVAVEPVARLVARWRPGGRWRRSGRCGTTRSGATRCRGLVGPRLTPASGRGGERYGAAFGASGAPGGGGARAGPHGRRPGRLVAGDGRGGRWCSPGSWCSAAATWSRGSCPPWARWCPRAGAGDLLGAWARGWRPVGLGARRARPPGLAGAAGLLGAVLAGQVGLARTLLTVGLMPLGVVGAHRLPRARRVEAGPGGGGGGLRRGAAALRRPGRGPVVGARPPTPRAPWMLRPPGPGVGRRPFGPGPTADAPILPAGAPTTGRPPPAVEARVVTGAVTAPGRPARAAGAGAAPPDGGRPGAGDLLRRARCGAWCGCLVATVGGAVVAAVLLLPTTLDVLARRAAVEPGWAPIGRRPGAVGRRRRRPAHRDGRHRRPSTFALLGAAPVPLLVGRRWRLGWACGAGRWPGGAGASCGPVSRAG